MDLQAASTMLLCLACSSSLPPPRRTEAKRGDLPGASSSISKLADTLVEEPFLTACCGRPICAACLSSNPRLARYNPCLHCLGGVAVVRSRSTPSLPITTVAKSTDNMKPHNIDGGVHDEDVFVLGDEDEDEEDDEHDRDREECPSKRREESATGSSSGSSTGPSTPPPPPYEHDISPHVASSSDIETEDQAGDDGTLTDADPKSSEPTAHSKYYIKPGDTLLGISLRFGVDVSLSYNLFQL